MAAQIRRPEQRTCEACGRVERWDDDASTWRVAEAGETFCIHEWDINGSFVPFEEA